MEIISNGVCAPKGFKASGIHIGIRKNRTKKDLCLIYSEKLCAAASVYTKNKVKGAPIYVTMNNLKNGVAQAIICNSGNANTCNEDGIYIASETCKLLANELKIKETEIIIASTGVIGERLSLEPFKNNMAKLVNNLDYNSSSAAEAIMTTDLTKKEIAVKFLLDGKEVTIGAMAKGSGMINPNMATMLCFITTDINISSEMLSTALKEDVVNSFNMISVDGDTSTNDMVSILANGLANNEKIVTKDKNYKIFKKHLNIVTDYLSKEIAKDGEGATKVIVSSVINSRSKKDARKIAKQIIYSNLLKAAMFGCDANWGRVLCAIGNAECNVDINKIDVYFESVEGKIKVCQNGQSINFNEDYAYKVLNTKEVKIITDLKSGKNKAQAYGCDLTYDYVKINGDYRS